MNGHPSEDVFEICLQRLQQGAGVDEILADFPGREQELRPLLLAAADLLRLGAGSQVPAQAQLRSRARFLEAAAAHAAAHARPDGLFHFFRFARAGLVVIAMLSAILLGTGLASAQALPGDVLYPVKRMVEQFQINNVRDGPDRLALEESLDNRRLEEAIQLSRVQRRQPVSFGGLLDLTGTGEYQVGGLTLSFPPDFPPPDILIGTYVQVNGYSDDDVVEVETLSPRQYQWNGVLEAVEERSWVISGTLIALDESTQLRGARPQVGAQVSVTVIRLADGQLWAVGLGVSPAPTSAQSPTFMYQPPARATPEFRSELEGPGPEKQVLGPSLPPRPAASATPALKQTSQPSATRQSEKESTRTGTSSLARTQSEESKPSRTPAPRGTASSEEKSDDDED